MASVQRSGNNFLYLSPGNESVCRVLWQSSTMPKVSFSLHCESSSLPKHCLEDL